MLIRDFRVNKNSVAYLDLVFFYYLTIFALFLGRLEIVVVNNLFTLYASPLLIIINVLNSMVDCSRETSAVL